MHLFDTAPTSDVQEFLITSIPVPPEIVSLRNPRLSADAAARLEATGMYPMWLLAACCADPDSLSRFATEVISAGIRSQYWTTATAHALVANPTVPDQVLWDLFDSGLPYGAAADFVQAVVSREQVGVFSELRRRATATGVALAAPRMSDVLLAVNELDLLSDLVRLELPTSALDVLTQHPLRFAAPELCARWLLNVSSSALEALLYNPNTTDSDTTDSEMLVDLLLTCPQVASAFTSRMTTADVSLASVNVIAWVAERASGFVTSPHGAKLCATVLASAAAISKMTVRRPVSLLRIAFDEACGSVGDETLEQFPPQPLYVAELLGRRGVTDPAAWKFALSPESQHGSAGSVADLAAASVA